MSSALNREGAAPADPKLTDPLAWNPKCSNFVIVDWEQFESTNPKPPRVYEPPQLNTGFTTRVALPTVWTGRSRWFNLLGYPLSLVSCLHSCCINNANFGTKKSALVTKDDLFEDLLHPGTMSEATPDVLKGLFWMRDNLAAETLLTFHNWAWKSTAKNAGKRELLSNANGDGVIGVGTLAYNWTYDFNIFGWAMRRFGGGSVYAQVQMSPSGKWIVLSSTTDLSEEGEVDYNCIYVVQPGDEFEIPKDDTDGDDHHTIQVRPGDLIRISWDPESPYVNSNDQMRYLYMVRRIAEWDSETQSVRKIQPDFDDYRRRASSSDIYKGKRPLCCGFWAGNMNPRERAELARKELATRQFYVVARTPPTPEDLDPL